MFRSFLGRVCTYGLVLGINGLPFAALALSGVVIEPALLTVAAVDEPEGDESVTARWTPISVDGLDDAVDEPEAELTPVLAPAAEQARPGVELPSGSTGEHLATATEGAATAGEGTGAGTAPGAGEATGGARPKRARNGGRAKMCEKVHPNIHPRDDGTVEIDRTLVDEYTRNLENFMSLGFSRPYDENGIEGWYISGFSCTSPVAKAGFKRGDILLAVNGKKTRSWVGVFMLYQRLKNKNDFEIELVRKGEPLTIKFRVVG